MNGIFVVIILVMLFVIVFFPKLGSVLIWPILFTYPHGSWYYSGFLPLNIGYDDLFCIVLFVSILIRRNIIEGRPIRTGYAFWVVTSFCVIATVSIVSGSLDYPSLYNLAFMKEILKLGIYWCLFYGILHCIDDERDLRRQLFMFTFAASIGACIVILHYFKPYMAGPWIKPETGDLVGSGGGTDLTVFTESARASGAFLNPNAAACILVCSLILVLTSMKVQHSKISKVLTYVAVVILFLGFLVTKSRSGIAAFVVVLLLMAFFSNNKMMAWLMIISGTFISVLFPGIRKTFTQRIMETYHTETGLWAENLLGRIKTWKDYFDTADFKTYLFGQGNIGGLLRNQVESHSAYVSLITVYGIGGVIWAMVSVYLYFKKNLFVIRYRNDRLSGLAYGCIFALLAWGIYALSSDAISSTYPRYLLFYLVVITDRVFEITNQHAIEYCCSPKIETNYTLQQYAL